jgi:guanidinopropionase
MSDDTTDAMMMETLYWWGVPTLFRCPHDPDLAHADIALVGVPHSSGNGSTERDQHLGPRAVRHVSARKPALSQAIDFPPWRPAASTIWAMPLPEAMDNEKCVETHFASSPDR